MANVSQKWLRINKQAHMFLFCFFYQAVSPSTSFENTHFLPSLTCPVKKSHPDKSMSPRFHILSPSCKHLRVALNGLGRRPPHTILSATVCLAPVTVGRQWFIRLWFVQFFNHVVPWKPSEPSCCDLSIVFLKRWRILASSPPTTMPLYTPEARQKKHHGWFCAAFGCPKVQPA